MMNTKITDVAVMFEDEIYSLPAPNRHDAVMRLIYSKGIRINGPKVQGFLDEDGVFLNRLEAMARAKETGQLNRREGVQFYRGPELYSEDLW